MTTLISWDIIPCRGGCESILNIVSLKIYLPRKTQNNAKKQDDFVTTQRTQKPKDYHHEEHEAHEGRFKQF